MSAALTTYELQCLGYVVQDLGGNPGLEGRFCWTNTHTNEFQNFATSSNSEAEAWAAAAAHWGEKHGLQGLLSAAPSGDLTPDHLAGQYNPGGANGDGEHPLFTRAGWRHAVEDGATVTGYWAWLACEISQGERRAQKQEVRPAKRPVDWLGTHH